MPQFKIGQKVVWKGEKVPMTIIEVLSSSKLKLTNPVILYLCNYWTNMEGFTNEIFVESELSKI